ncbi:hypothetical protein WJ60_06425 [Burkholderia ubonensis]|uniref:fimbrial biogenesis chaperone n=1 Tax=Burkholderia ubonensis TaxID=101571 RepID=UPI0007570273|nr:fimbria/pilus periplasmic chaperone [Burkholderia ubonensis]KVM73941.1 hypothetical protein WJ60_06425 [Burkholderia ubonensis]
MPETRPLALRLAALASVLAVLAAAPAAQAGIDINTTRIVFPADQREVPVEVTNTGAAPERIRAWGDDGDIHAIPASNRAPFIVSPSMADIAPGKTQTLRIRFDGNALPNHSESVFWLNVLDTPPRPSIAFESTHTLLAVAARTRIKLFYRPARLPGNAREAVTHIHWTLLRECGHDTLQATNPTPYSASFAQLAIARDNAVTLADGKPGTDMVKPGTTALFPISGHIAANDGLHLRYQAIDDYGGVFPGEAPLPVESKPSCSER